MTKSSHPSTRLGLDIGANSIGWWLYATDNSQVTEVIDGGVRIFSDGRVPKSKSSLAVERRAARSTRRRRDRYLRRRAALRRRLAEAGLMPANPHDAKVLELLDPYELRARGLDEALPLTHLGRAVFHLNQRRGFKSNRKTDRRDNESGKIKAATTRLDQAMMLKPARTFGEFLHLRRSDKREKPSHEKRTNTDGTRSDDRRTQSVRSRLSVARRDGGDKQEPGYDFYPLRRHLEEEFEKLWDAQVEKHKQLDANNKKILAREWQQDTDKLNLVEHDPRPSVLTDDLRRALFEVIFHQRPLKEPEIGLCLFSGQPGVRSNERRLPKAHPLAQRRVLYETVNNLRVIVDSQEKRPLTLAQRDKIIHALDNRKHTKSPKSMLLTLDKLGRLIGLATNERFTMETKIRDSIACDPVRASLNHPDRFGSRWSELDMSAQCEVIQRIRALQSDAESEKFKNWLRETHGLDDDHAEATANAPLLEGYGRIGESATRKILHELQSNVVTYNEAVKACGWHHSDDRTGEVPELPYYGAILDRHVIPGSGRPKDDCITRFGRITNPTVHIGLNQLRRLVNKIISTYGKPDEIVVELARELKQSLKQKQDAQKRIRENTDAARKRSEKLSELKQPDTGANRMILRLWEELNKDDCMRRFCPYTGHRISAEMLFDGSCDVDHILPYSRTMDNSFANRTLCKREANREKAAQTPWEVWGDTQEWSKITNNLKNLPENKRWRFSRDAMEKFEGENNFLDRELVDTQYLSRIARAYLDKLYDKSGHVRVVSGRLTEMLRRHWGLNSLLSNCTKDSIKAKNRTDHRHHAIDAAVIAATDRSLIQRISTAASRDEGNGLSAEYVARTTPPPWPGFRNDIGNRLDQIVVSHRADHGRIDPFAKRIGRDSTSGQLHNDTAYGIVDKQSVVSRKPLLSLKSGDITKTLKGKNIRDPYLQELLAEVIEGAKTPKDVQFVLHQFVRAEWLSNGKPNPYLGIRRVRLIESLRSSARVEIKDGLSKPYKAYKGDSNHCYEIWRMPDGKLNAQVVTTFEAHSNTVPRPHPAAKRLLRVFKRDMVAIECDGQRSIFYVQKFNSSNGIYIAPHNESNADARDRDSNDEFCLIRMGIKKILKLRLRRIFVDEIGRLQDAGPSVV